MTLLVLVILAMVWAAVLLPPYLQNRSEGRPGDSISSFQKQLSVLERRSGATSMGPARTRPMVSSGNLSARRPAPAYSAARMSRAEARKRRRDVLFTLMVAAGTSFLLAVLMGGTVWLLHLACDVALGSFVMLLAQANQRAAEQEMKVRYLPRSQARRVPEAALLLRRSGS